MDVKCLQSTHVHSQLYRKDGDDHGDVVIEESNAEHKEEEDYEDDVPNPSENKESSSDCDASRTSSTCQENQEFIYVELANIRKDVQCPICLGIIKKTRTVMECLHRFCRECIDKSMRMGNNECPACRTHCASRRSLRDDPNYDALIAALYPDIEKYEEEELTFHEEERNRNKQIQAAISQVFQRQEVLAKRRMQKDAASRPHHSAKFRRRRDSHDGDASDENGRRKCSTSTDEMSAEGPCRRRAAEAVSSHARCSENDPKPNHTFYPDFELAASEMLAWGGGGARSHNRSRVRNTRLCRLLDHLRTSGRDNDELLHLLLVSEDEQKACGLQKPFICCSPSVTVKHLCQYVASQMKLLHWEDIEMVAAKPNADEVHVLKAGETLSVLKAGLNLKLVYRVKKKMEE